MSSLVYEYVAAGPYYDSASDSYAYMDDMGHFTAMGFSWISLETLEDEEYAEAYALGAGEVGLCVDGFQEDVSGYNCHIDQFYTVSDHDAPSIRFADEAPLGENDSMEYTYDELEALALQERYGSSEHDSLEGYIEGFISTLSADVTTTATVTEYTFKKIIHDVLDYDNLSSFAQEEEEQAVSVTTSFVSGSY